MKKKILKTRTTGLFLVTFLMFLLSSTDLFSADAPTDREISNAVERQFMFHSTIPFHLIDVETYDGIVTLSGTVNELLAKDRAVKVAQMVKGVRAVVDEIEVAVVHGVVYLNGEVNSYYEKSQAENIASKIKGVVGVKNNLDVKYADDYDYYDYYGWNRNYPPLYTPDGQKQRKSDNEIQNSIENQLWWSPYVNKEEVVVSVSNGTAYLEGTVATEREKLFAEINALEGGAEEVVNKIDTK